MPRRWLSSSLSKRKNEFLAANLIAGDEPALPEASPIGEAISGFRDPVLANRDPHSANRDPHSANRDPHSANRDPHSANRDPHSANRDPHSANRDPHSENQDPLPAKRDPVPAKRDPLPANREPQSNREQDSAPKDPHAAGRDALAVRKDPQAETQEVEAFIPYENRIRIALKVEYDGTKFSGSQMQANTRTVQEDLEKALTAFFRSKERIVVNFSGRTDSGVHASGQVAHFDISGDQLVRAFNKHANQCEHQVELDEYTLRQLCLSLNGILKSDMAIVCAQQVPLKFHSRFKAIRRTYVYRILNRPQRTALGYNAQYFVHSSLNISNMQEAAQHLLGTHDFSAFKSTNADEVSPICTVNRAELLNYGEGKLEFWISADHFVYNMVRIIVGTLVDIGLGKREPSDLSYALTEKGRHLSGPTAPALGLCLHQVDYPAEFNLFHQEI